MKKIFLIAFCLGFCVMNAQSLRNVKGSKGVDVTVHFSKFGKAASLGYSQNLTDKVGLKLKLNYEAGKIGYSDYSTIFFMPSLTFNVARVKSLFFLDAEVGALGGYENAKNKELLTDDKTLVYGAFAGAEGKIFITDNMAFLVNFHELFTYKSKFGTYRYQAGIGLRLYF